MTPELYWLALSAVFLLVCWLPYIMDRTLVRGLPRALGNPRDDDKPQSAWAVRAQKAHQNGVENLVVMATLVIVAHLAKISTSTTVLMVQVYFWARIAHFVVFTAGVPYVRTLTFFAGWVATAWIALAILGLV